MAVRLPLDTAPQARRLHWAQATATGQLVSRPCWLYAARLVAKTSGSGAASVLFHDDTTANQAGPALLALGIGQTGADDWPKVPVAIYFTKGVDLEVTGTNVFVLVGWSGE